MTDLVHFQKSADWADSIHVDSVLNLCIWSND
jgi:hypothetical protein